MQGHGGHEDSTQREHSRPERHADIFFCCAETVLTTALQCHHKDKRKIMAQDTFRRKKKSLFCLKLTQMCGLRSPKLKPEPGAIRKCFLGDKQFYSDWHRSKII